MKKILAILFVFVGVLFFHFSLEIEDSFSADRWFFHNTAQIMIVHETYLPEEELLAHIQHMQEAHGVYIARVIWQNAARNISVFTTDTTMGGTVSLKYGHFPAPMSTDYIASRPMGGSGQVGEFYHFNTQGREMQIFPMDALGGFSGFSGRFVLGTADEEIILEIIEYLDSVFVGTVRLDRIFGPMEYTALFLWTVGNFFSLFFLIGIIAILLFFAFMRYIVMQSKRNAVMKLFGYSRWKMMVWHMRELWPLCAVSVLLTSLYIVCVLAIQGNMFFWQIFIRGTIVLHIALFFISLLLIYGATAVQLRCYNTPQILKGEKPFRALSILHIFLKYLTLVFFLFALLFVQREEALLEEKQQANALWQSAQHVYATTVRFIGDMQDLQSIRPQEQRAKLVYRDLVENLELFMINASNFMQMSDGRYLFEWNLELPQNSVYSPAGRRIDVNENFLRRHPVYTQDGILVTEEFIWDPFVVNILVPITFAEYEDRIEEEFLEFFYFRKVEVSNIYNNAFGLPPGDIAKSDLRVNIIYVPEGMYYFTYNFNAAVSSGNQIRDPIVFVETFNVDASFYYAWLSNYAFFESLSIDPANDIRPFVAAQSMTSVLDSVRSLHVLREIELETLETNLDGLRFARLVLFAIFIFSIFLFFACHYAQNQHSIYIKRILGHSLGRINAWLLLFNILLTLAIIVSFPLAWYIKLMVVALDIFFMVMFNLRIGRKSFVQAVKGGN